MLSSPSPKPGRTMPAHEWWHRCHSQVPNLITSRSTKRYWHRSVCTRPLSPVSPLFELRCLMEEVLAFPWWPYVCGTLKQSLGRKGLLSFPLPGCLITCCFRSWTWWSLWIPSSSVYSMILWFISWTLNHCASYCTYVYQRPSVPQGSCSQYSPRPICNFRVLF